MLEPEPEPYPDPSSALASHWPGLGYTVAGSSCPAPVGTMLVVYLGAVGGRLLQKLAALYQLLMDLAGLDVGPWMDVGSFQNDP